MLPEREKFLPSKNQDEKIKLCLFSASFRVIKMQYHNFYIIGHITANIISTKGSLETFSCSSNYNFLVIFQFKTEAWTRLPKLLFNSTFPSHLDKYEKKYQPPSSADVCFSVLKFYFTISLLQWKCTNIQGVSN